jgi:hypothetical protein
LRVSSIPIKQIVTHIHVADTDSATYFASSELTTTVSNLRLARAATSILRKGPSTVIAVQGFPDSDKVMALIEAHYTTRKARFRRQDVDPAYVAFSADRLRGEVIPGSRFWEQVEGALTMSPMGHELRLYLNMDGRYAAAGIGDNPPGGGGFSDFEPAYTKQLQEYSAERLQQWRLQIMDLLK